MKHFFYEPRKGFKKSPADFAGGLAAGTAGLAGGVVGGTGAYAFGLVSMVMGGVSNGFGALAIDPQYNARRQLAQQQHVAHSGEGLLLGMQALGHGLIGGVSGVIEQPIRGMAHGGGLGFVKGVGRGLVGIVAKPLSGIAAAVSKTSEGVAADARRVTPGQLFRSRADQHRVRQPRVIGPDGVLLPYPRPPLLDVPLGELGVVGAPPGAAPAADEAHGGAGRQGAGTADGPVQSSAAVIATEAGAPSPSEEMLIDSTLRAL